MRRPREASRSGAATESSYLLRRGTSLGRLQVEADPFAIHKDETGVDQLLAGGIVVSVDIQELERQDELDGQRTSAGVLVRGEAHSGAEVNAVEIAPVLKVGEHRADEVRDVLIER